MRAVECTIYHPKLTPLAGWPENWAKVCVFGTTGKCRRPKVTFFAFGKSFIQIPYPNPTKTTVCHIINLKPPLYTCRCTMQAQDLKGRFASMVARSQLLCPLRRELRLQASLSVSFSIYVNAGLACASQRLGGFSPCCLVRGCASLIVFGASLRCSPLAQPAAGWMPGQLQGSMPPVIS